MGRVTVEWSDYCHESQPEAIRLDAPGSVRRSLHVLPSGLRPYAIAACAARTSARTCSVSSAFSSTKVGLVFTE